MTFKVLFRISLNFKVSHDFKTTTIQTKSQLFYLYFQEMCAKKNIRKILFLSKKLKIYEIFCSPAAHCNTILRLGRMQLISVFASPAELVWGRAKKKYVLKKGTFWALFKKLFSQTEEFSVNRPRFTSSHPRQEQLIGRGKMRTSKLYFIKGNQLIDL